MYFRSRVVDEALVHRDDPSDAVSIPTDVMAAPTMAVESITVENSSCQIGNSVHVHGPLNVKCKKFGGWPRSDEGLEDGLRHDLKQEGCSAGSAARRGRGAVVLSAAFLTLPETLHKPTGGTSATAPAKQCEGCRWCRADAPCADVLTPRRLLVLVPCAFLVATSVSLVVFFRPVPSPSDEHTDAPSSVTSTEPPESPPPLPLPNGVEFVSKSLWGARAVRWPPERLPTPVATVIVHHSGTLPCIDLHTCCERVFVMQQYNMNGRNWSDIGYNFLVGGDGRVYEGRGWDAVGGGRGQAWGEALQRWHHEALGVAVVGTFTEELPSDRQRQQLSSFLQWGVDLGKIKPDYRLVGACQLQPTKSPGLRFMQDLRTWSHWWDNGADWADLCTPAA